MNEISVHAEIDYKVRVGQEWLPFLQSVRTDHTKVLVVAPESVVQLAGLAELSSRHDFELFIAPDGEEQKNFTTVEQLWMKLGSLDFVALLGMRFLRRSPAWWMLQWVARQELILRLERI